MTIHLPDGALTAKPTVRNLGVQLDSELSFDAQARNYVKSCYYHLRRINQIKRYVDQECLRIRCIRIASREREDKMQIKQHPNTKFYTLYSDKCLTKI